MYMTLKCQGSDMSSVYVVTEVIHAAYQPMLLDETVPTRLARLNRVSLEATTTSALSCL